MTEKKKSACEIVRERREELARKAKCASSEKKEELRRSITERLRGKSEISETAEKNGN